MKYSEFLEIVLGQLISGQNSKYICNQSAMRFPTEEMLPHKKQLKQAINRKILKFMRENKADPKLMLTLSPVFQDYTSIDSRVKWLKSLIEANQKKGN